MNTQLSHPDMRATDSLAGCSGMSLNAFQPRLIAGETKQAYLTASFKDGQTVRRPLPARMPAMQLSQRLRSATILTDYPL
jgi:hypothetical protein